MEDSISFFFINGLKLHIESSFNKLNDMQAIIFKEDFEEIFLNNIFINNINLFRDIITQNNLHFPTFLSHIEKLMKLPLENYITKFTEELNGEKNKNIEDNKSIMDLGEINLLKLKMLKISLYLITNLESENFLNSRNEEKDKLEELLI